MRFAVKRPLSNDATIKRCQQIGEGRTQELSVKWGQGAYTNVIEQRASGIVQLGPEIRDGNAAVVKWLVKGGQRSTDTGASWFRIRIVVQTVPKGNDKTALLVPHRK